MKVRSSIKRICERCRIVRRRDGVPPFRLAWGGRRAWGVLELAAGWLPGPAAQPGDRLVFHDA